MKYKTELHCHTGDVSDCGKECADYIANRYIDEGYTSLVVTNHMSIYTYSGPKYKAYLEKTGKTDSWNTKVDFFMTGYTNMIKAAKGNLNVMLGMEFRSFVSSQANDYLVFGITEEWLRNSPCILEMRIREMSKYVHESGLLIYQAHPFRDGMTIINPKYLDGIEVFNGHVFHHSRNSIAEAWADLHGLKRTSGTDFHEKAHILCGGILTDEPITNSSQLLEVLNSEKYELLKSDNFQK